ncbi:hypothetical protein PI124_g12782 [Phytophthora idaei]|nr:hypothetical protein PI125_g18933 [Phytophthora idaei]KAG3148234.1 hypothetical protein PI126_g12524 [Phytophthora idaei]KAG3242366.1 hypothetical protein PI124_g12782 [Phytophthora idaei]
MRVVDPAGYDNYLIEREDDEGHEQLIAHVSFLVSCYYPHSLLQTAALDSAVQLEYEGTLERGTDVATSGAAVAATTAPVHAATTARGTNKSERAVANDVSQQDGMLVELRRRRRRNAAGQYVLEHELRPIQLRGRRQTGGTNDDIGRRWVSAKEYEHLFSSDRVMEVSLSVGKTCNRARTVPAETDGNLEVWREDRQLARCGERPQILSGSDHLTEDREVSRTRELDDMPRRA